MEFLIFIPSPRDIPEIQQALDKIDFIDKFYVKYTKEYPAYQKAQEFFLENDHYSHILICPDDLLIEKEHIIQLIADTMQYNYPVIGGLCQVDNDDFKDDMAFSLTPFKPRISDRFRYFEKFDKYFFHDKLRSEYQDNPILRTMWQGFPLTCIRKDVIQEIGFRDDAEFKGLPRGSGCCIDDGFCYDCIQNEIPMYTDLRIRMNHLKFNDNNTRMQLVKDKKPYTKLVKKTRDFKIDVFEYSEIKK